ncbi:hypothetical protein TURU_058960 [Turdus rufiventris]|nr:hypothetical protein TURU_058960 [Turdus rufiventris]
MILTNENNMSEKKWEVSMESVLRTPFICIRLNDVTLLPGTISGQQQRYLRKGKGHRAVESLHSLNDQISHFIVNKAKTLDEDEDAFLPSEKESLKSAMMLMRHLLMDAQGFKPELEPCKGWILLSTITA